MFCTPPETRKARKEHFCTYCGEKILPGETYQAWRSVDATWFANKMHPECLADLQEWGDGEYTAYCGERPRRDERAAV